MAELVSKHLPVILLGTGVASLSAALGYYAGKNKSATPKESDAVKVKEQEITVSKMFTSENDPVMAYIMENSLREPEFLLKLREGTEEKFGRAIRMLIDPLEAQFLRLFLSACGAKRCIEVGTFTGYNACSVALALPEDGEIIACDVSREFLDGGKIFWTDECNKKIKIEIAPAIETLDRLIEEGQSGTFDFVFIDADKQNYGRYYERSLVLLRQGGIVAVDNTLWGGKVLGDPSTFTDDTKAIYELDKKIKSDNRVDISMLRLGDGTTLCRKK